jgi:hypothetical protein
MRQGAIAAVLAIFATFASLTAAFGQGAGPGPKVGTGIVGGSKIMPLGIYVVGGVACSAIAPIVGTAILGRELTAAEVGRSTLGCFLGPVGWVLGPVLFPDKVVADRAPPRRTTRQRQGRNVDLPPPGEARFVPNEVLLQIAGNASPRTLATIARRLQLTRLETQSFALTARTLQRWRIDGNRTVAAILHALARYPSVLRAQPNYLYALQQAPDAPSPQSAAPTPDPAQYVVGKLRLLQAHRVSTGDAVAVAVIDSQIDVDHPDLTGVVAGQFDALGGAGKPHEHGTAMAGAIAAHGKLIGVAPKVRLLAVRAFAGTGESAAGTSFAILKGLDWSAAKGARVVNMSFAGPADPMLHEMLAKAHDRGLVLIAAVGNAGPRSPPLYPAADRAVIGVTATDADNKLLPVANRGAQVVIAAPGVGILADAPDGAFAFTSGTSIAAAHVSGVAALLLARQPQLTPAALRRVLVGSAQRIPGKPREVGAGVVDAYGALERLAP